jgi:GT2 family glycosyltransferase
MTSSIVMSAGQCLGALPASPAVSVVIISRNEGSELLATTSNVLATLPRQQRQVIIVDDDSTDSSTEFLKEAADVMLVRSPGIGVARARNLGASHATGDVVVFLDAHVRLPENWIDPLVESLRDPQVGAVAPGVYSISEPKCRGFGLDLAGPDLKARWLRKPGSLPEKVPILPGCCLAMRQDALQSSGGYDPAMKQLGGNDAELSCRLWLQGYELLVVPSLEVGHLFRAVAPYPARWAALVHNRLRMAFVHFGQARLERVIQALRTYDAFPAAMAMMLETDYYSRRAEISKARQFDDDWFFERFAITC